MSAPLHARDVKGKGRYYGTCGKDDCPLGEDLFISITNAQGSIAKPALVPAAVKVTASAAWQQLPRMVATSRQAENGPNGCEKKRVSDRCGHCRFCITAAIKAEHRNQWEHAADHGSLVHAYAHAHIVGEPMPYDPDVEPFIFQYLRFLDAWGVDLDRHVEAAETTVVDRPNGYAGTGDVWLHLPISPTGKPSKRRYLWLIDLKTSLKKAADTVYVDQVLQLAALRFAPKAILPDDSEIDVPEFAGAALLNLRSDAHALIPLPADRGAHAAFVNAVGLQSFLHAQDIKTWVQLDAPVMPEPARKAS